jgi:hypothetical protein
MTNLILILVLIILGFYAMTLLLSRSQDFDNYKRTNNFFDFTKFRLDLVSSEMLLPNNFLFNKLGDGYYWRFLVPAFVVSMISIVFLGPLLTNFFYGIFLGIIIACAYCLRIFFHQAQIFRELLLTQVENILRQIRNHLSSGSSLDYTLNLVKSQTQNLRPIGQDLLKFLQTVEANFFEAFPQWLVMLKHRYGLKELSDSSQILSLELKYTHNQEQAFLTAITAISNRITLNKKTQNLISLTFLSLDFMIIAFLAVIFYVIPSFAFDLEHSWWLSSRRILVVFVTSLSLWLCYLVTILIALRRLA